MGESGGEIEVRSVRRVYEGSPILSLEVHDVRLPNGVLRQLELIHHSGAAAVVPVERDGTVVLIEQLRYAAARSTLIEIPAGKLEPGEAPEACARRELEEETGYRAHSMERLAGFYPAPGSMTEWMTVWVARGLAPSRAHRDDDEVIRVRRFPVGEVKAMLTSGKVKDAKSLVGLLAFFQGFGEVRPPVAAPPPPPARRARRAASSAPRR